MNEENVKNQIVIPWLKEAGIEVDELQFETSFTVHLGRQSIRVGDGKESAAARGRLDILVTRATKNLLLIEVKAADHTLTDDDRDQAISYARIVDPIAPYTVVTNGENFNLYQTIDKQLIQPTSIEVNGMELSLPEEDIAEAQTLFLRLSHSNLMSFCRQVTNDGLELLKGGIDLQKKYVPEIHVPRLDVVNEASNFLMTDDSALIITGPSGMGKSCELCSISEYLLSIDQPVFFFNGSLLEGGVLDAIAAEFEWQFDGEISPIRVLKRIERFSRGKGCVILVDAIDEWSHIQRAVQIANLIKSIKGRNLKLILTCKDSSLDEFTTIRGQDTWPLHSTQIIQLSPFTKKEFHEALFRYRAAYGINNLFDNDVLIRARENPFLLRILFDVAKDHESKAFTFESGAIFEAYLRLITRKTTNPSKAIRTINAIAHELYDQNADQIPENDIRSTLGLSINDELMEELFEYSVLFRTETNIGLTSIGFYFQQLRDYVIAFSTVRFGEMTDDELKLIISETTFPSAKGDALMLFYRIAAIEQKLRIDRDFRHSATLYLSSYVNSIESNFPSLGDKFDPSGDNRVGLVGELLMPGLRIGYHGFRPITEDDLEVEFIPVASLDTELGERGWNRIFRGVSTAKLSLQNCVFQEGEDIVHEVVKSEIFPQLEPLIMNGKLNEKNNPEMLREYIVGIVIENSSMFKSLYRDNSSELPSIISLVDVYTCMLAARLEYHFETEYFEAQRKSGAATEHNFGSYISYTHRWTPEGRRWVADMVNQALAAGKYFEDDELQSHVDLSELNRGVTTAIRQLESLNITSVETNFQGHKKTDIAACKNVDVQILGDYLIDLYKSYHTNFKEFVRINLPTLCHLPEFQIEFYSLHIVIGPLQTDRGGRSDRGLTCYYVEQEDNLTQVSIITETDVDFRRESWTVKIRDNVYKLHSISHTSVKSFCRKDSGLYDSKFYEMPIRSYVYSKTLSAIKKSDDSDIIEAIMTSSSISP